MTCKYSTQCREPASQYHNNTKQHNLYSIVAEYAAKSSGYNMQFSYSSKPIRLGEGYKN